MLLGTLGSSLLGDILASKGVVRSGDGVIWVGEGTNIAGYNF